MISIILASHGGQNRLPATLGLLGQLKVPAGGYELLLIDSASTDDTGSLLRAWARTAGCCRVLSMDAPGKNRALNCALLHARGDLIVFLDDDITVGDDWLLLYEECAADNVEYDVFGGAIVPLWPLPPPAWILEGIPLSDVYAASDPSWPAGETSHHRVWGGNMAIRRRVFDAGHRFNEQIGPDGTSRYVSGSETEFVRRLQELGYRAWYEPTIAVRHRIERKQLQLGYVLRRALRTGRMQARELSRAGVGAVGARGAYPWWTLRLLGRAACRLLASLVIKPSPANWASKTWALFVAVGQVAESHRAYRDAV